MAELVLEAARHPARADAIREATGITDEGLGAVLRCLRFEGRLVTLAGDSLLSSPHAHVATGSWAPEGLGATDRHQALAWLAGQYLRAYGPARVEDFAWWTGVTRREAARAVEAHRTKDLGDGLLILAHDEAAFGRVKPLRNAVALLPRWDSYTMGHAPDGASAIRRSQCPASGLHADRGRASR